MAKEHLLNHREIDALSPKARTAYLAGRGIPRADASAHPAMEAPAISGDRREFVQPPKNHSNSRMAKIEEDHFVFEPDDPAPMQVVRIQPRRVRALRPGQRIIEVDGVPMRAWDAELAFRAQRPR